MTTTVLPALLLLLFSSLALGLQHQAIYSLFAKDAYNSPDPEIEAFFKDYSWETPHFYDLSKQVRGVNLRAKIHFNSETFEIVIAFKGSDFNMESEGGITDLLTNLNIEQVPCADVIPNCKGEVHAGILQYYKSIRANLHKDLTKFISKHKLTEQPQLSITAVGHSQGGALAILCGYDLVKNFKRSSSSIAVRVITYGSPKVGEKRFAKGYDDLGIDTTRYVLKSNTGAVDFVTVLPPDLFGSWKHVKGAKNLPCKKNTKDDTLGCHYMETYMDFFYSGSADRDKIFRMMQRKEEERAAVRDKSEL